MKKVFIYILLFILIFCYSYFLGPFISDEIWNYGFSYNISHGLVIYRDFNVLQTPLLFFFGSIFISIFGHHLWSINILNTFIILSIFIVLYKDIGNKSFIIDPIILLYCFYSYSLLCVLLLIIILYINNNEFKYKDIYIALVTSFVFLTKQHVGICMFVPMILYSKNKIKSFVMFLIPIIILSIYLILNDALYNFFDCCFLGMLEFGSNNGNYNFFTIFWIISIIYIIYQLISSKFKDSNIFYIFAFHVMALPIFDSYHFMLCFIFILYYLVSKYEIKKSNYKYFIIISCCFFLFMLYDSNSIKYFSLCDDSNSFMYGRNINNHYVNRTGDVYDFINNNIYDYEDNIYLISNNAYLIKLELGMRINNFDLLLDGNMGYNGDVKRINELNDICSSSKCLFIVDKGIVGVQLNINIRNYVIENYKYIKDLEYYQVYSNVGDYDA